MPLLPLDLPAGFYRNGTDIEQSGRWREGSLVRWLDGSLRPVGGWSVRKEGFSKNPIRGMHSWQSNNGTAWLAGGSADELIVMTGAGVAYDITPDDLSIGRVDASVLTGYGYGFYGTGIFGQPRPVTSDSIPEESTIWVLDNFGEQLIALCSTDGRLFVWDLTTTVGSELIVNGNFATDSNWTKGTNWSITTNQYAKYAQYKPTFNADNVTIVDPAADTITITGHDFSDGDEVKYNVPVSPASAIGGLTDATNYFIISATANTFQLSATSGGAAIDITPNNEVIFDADDDTIKDVANNKIITANTFSNGDYVTYENGGGTDIGNLTNNSNYFVVNATSSEFQLSLTSGGAAIDLTADPTATIDPNGIATSATSVAVTVASGTLYGGGTGNIFYLDGVANPSLTLIQGTTYTFDVSDGTNGGHPFRFKDALGNAFAVTASGTEGTAGATVTLTVPTSGTMPASYYCTSHGAGMGNLVTTVTAAAANGPIDYATETITIANHGLADGNEVTYSNGGGTDIGGLTTGTNYFVVSASTDTFKLSATLGGSAINLTAPSGSLGTNHSFELDIGSTHKFRVDVGDNHELERLNFGNLDQTITGLQPDTEIITVDGNNNAQVNYSSNRIIASNVFQNNTQVTYSKGNGVNINGLIDGTTYFLRNVSPSEFQLSATLTGAFIDFISPNQVLIDGSNASENNSVTISDSTDASIINASTDKIIITNSFSNDQQVTYSNNNGTDIAGLSNGTTYFIINATSSEFQLAATSGGSAIDITGVGVGNNHLFQHVGFSVDLTNDKVIISNTFSNGEIVTYSNGGSGATDIAGLTNNTNYHIINATSTEFQLSATSGGAAVDVTGVGTGNSHTFTQNIGASHTFTHNFGNNQDSYDLEITIVDLDHDNNPSTVPVASVKLAGTTSSTEFVNQNLFIGRNEFRFGSDDTTAKIEIIPSVYNTPDFYVDNITLKKKTVAEPIQNAPINNKAHVVTEERFLFALGAGGNSRLVQWCDFENLTQWTAATTNQSGSTELATAGQIMQGIRTRAGTLIITDTDSHLLTYVGPPYIYSAQRIATECGAVSRFSAVDTDIGTFWYGQENFFYFDGNTVQVLACDVHDYVFGDFNPSQQSKIWGYVNGTNNEVWWYYCSSQATEIDRYVAYNYREKHWLIGNMSRTSGVPRGVFAYPFLSGQETETITLNVTVANDGGNKYYISTYTGSAPTVELVKGNTYRFDQSASSNDGHPLRFSAQPDGIHAGGVEYINGITVVGTAGTSGAYTEIVVGEYTPTLYFYCSNHPLMGSNANILEKVKIYNHEIGVNYDGGEQFAETGPISLANGDNIMKVNSVIPDEKTQGDVQMTFKTRFHPNDTERSYGPFDPTNPTSLRFSGRQIRMRVTGDQATDWRVGTMRLNTTSGGRR